VNGFTNGGTRPLVARAQFERINAAAELASCADLIERAPDARFHATAGIKTLAEF